MIKPTSLIPKFILRVLMGVPGWISQILVQIPLILLGIVLIPIWCWVDRINKSALSYRMSEEYPGRSVLSFKGLWLYSNEEDGVDGAANGFWPEPTDYSKPSIWQIFKWSALRNSVGNARWLPFFSVPVYVRGNFVPNMIGLSDQCWVAWDGWHYELHFPWTKTRAFWIGWRLSSAYKLGYSVGIGFTFQPWNKYSS
jgi:hypothetical protein